jgi:hypothetical protein
MIINIMSKSTIAAIFSLTMVYPAYAVEPINFTAGEPASADDVNANFTDLHGRVATLEGAGGIPTLVAVDCDADPNALAIIAITANTTYDITGACNGPIYVNEDGVSLTGTNNATDSIVLPSGLNGEGAINASGADDLRITNLFIDLTNTAISDEAGGIFARNSFVRVRDSRVIGGVYGINPYRNAIVRLDGTNSITEFSSNGLIANDLSNINARGQVTLTSTRTDGDDIAAVATYRNGVIDLRAGAIISVEATLGNDEAGYAVFASENSTVRIRNNGTVTLSGDVASGRSSTVRIEKGTITGNIEIHQSSTIEVKNGVVVDGNLDIYDLGSLIMDGGSISGTIYAETNSVIVLDEVSHTNSDLEAISLSTNSSLLSEGSSLGNQSLVVSFTMAV